MKSVSIVIPTYNERENLPELVERIFKACKGKLKATVIIVDDNSPDKTYETAKKLGKRFNVKAVCRKTERGLSSAVVEGFKLAEGEILGVMDADLSHPPEKIPEMVKALQKADVVVASRLMKGGGVEEWPLIRRIISKGATLLARPLTGVSDPMSGFFFFKRRILTGVTLSPMGYKILLEVLVKGRYESVAEVPYVFINRQVGESKLNMRIQAQYARHVLDLYLFKLFH
jgi:dolichol-phosphate mannosyltransferase